MDVDAYDNPAWIQNQEKFYLGCPLSASAVDHKSVDGTDRCVECYGDIPLWQKRTVAVVLDEVILTETKNGSNPGQSMARIHVYDSSGKLENLPVFPDTYAEYDDLLIENNTVLLYIKMGKRGWVVEKIEQI